jgi:transcriptional regulator with XRE-family HTH domain
METIGSRLKVCRNYLNYSLKDMSGKLAIKAWDSYEYNRSLPGTNVLLKLAEQGISIDWILTGDGEMLIEPNITNINRDLLEKIINLIEGEIENSGYKIPAHRKANVYFKIHDEIKQSNSKFEDKVDEITSLFNALAKF